MYIRLLDSENGGIVGLTDASPSGADKIGHPTFVECGTAKVYSQAENNVCVGEMSLTHKGDSVRFTPD